MKIDIDKLSYDELIDLNNRVVERLKFRANVKSGVQRLNQAAT